MNRGTAKAHGLSFLFIRNLCYIHFPPCFIIVPQFAISVGITGPSGSSFSSAFVLPLSLHLSPNHSVNHPASVYRLSFLKLLSFLPSSSAPLFSTQPLCPLRGGFLQKTASVAWPPLSLRLASCIPRVGCLARTLVVPNIFLTHPSSSPMSRGASA